MTTHGEGILTPPIGNESLLPEGVTHASPWIRLGATILASVLVLATLVFGYLIWAVMIVGRGQTPEKSLLNLRVIDAGSLRPVGFAKMFWLRGVVAGIVVSVVVPLTLGILLFMPFWDRRNQNIWDKISGTYVVLDPRDAWGTKTERRQS